MGAICPAYLSCKVGRGKLLISFLLSQGVGREKAPVLLCTAHFIILYDLQLGGGRGYESIIT